MAPTKATSFQRTVLGALERHPNLYVHQTICRTYSEKVVIRFGRRGDISGQIREIFGIIGLLKQILPRETMYEWEVITPELIKMQKDTRWIDITVRPETTTTKARCQRRVH